jgi:hypothetical protein
MLVDSSHVTSFSEGYQKLRRVRCRSAGIQTVESEHRGQAMFHATDGVEAPVEGASGGRD